MDLKRPIRLSFRWRLFIPLVLLVWTIIGVLVCIQDHNESEFKAQMMRNELSLIEQRIIFSYEKGYDIAEFVKFLNRYYSGSVFNVMRVTVYDGNDSVIAAVGEPIPIDTDTLRDLEPENPETRLINMAAIESDSDNSDGHELFYTNTVSSRDSSIVVKTAMPHTYSLSRALESSPHLWLMLLSVTAAATAIVYFSTRFFSRNITLLRRFASEASAGKINTNPDKFPNDELGDISREIITIYNQRIKALERSEREHRVALHAIEEKSRLKRQMTNNINHELKTPIGVIRGYLDTIIGTPDMDENTRTHFLARTRENVERICTLLNDISTITRLEEGHGNIPLSEVNMHDILYSIENDIEAANLCPGMTFSYNVPLDCVVLGNQNLITGMILNLIKNSSLHSHGTEISLNLINENAKTYVFAFADNGDGVGPEHIPHLFDRFYRVDSGRSRKAGGTGLGLPIVKSTVQSLGGAISVHNRSTGGLEIVFTLHKFLG